MVRRMSGNLKAGDRIRALVTRYPVHAGATGRVLEVKTFPLPGALVQWDYPQGNLSPLPQSLLWPWDYKHYEIVTGFPDESVEDS